MFTGQIKRVHDGLTLVERGAFLPLFLTEADSPNNVVLVTPFIHPPLAQRLP